MKPLASAILILGHVAWARAAPEAKPVGVAWELLSRLDYKKGIAPRELKELDGKLVRVPGFIVPLDFSQSKEVGEFLLTPAYPGCLHVPPPTPAQTVLVKMETGRKAKMTWGPVWVSGRLQLILAKKTGYGEASYEMVGQSTSEYNVNDGGDKLVNQAIGGGAGLPFLKRSGASSGK